MQILFTADWLLTAVGWHSSVHTGQVYGYLGSLGDLLPLDIFGDFLPIQSSLSSMSLESEQLQLSIMADIRLLPYISSEDRKQMMDRIEWLFGKWLITVQFLTLQPTFSSVVYFPCDGHCENVHGLAVSNKSVRKDATNMKCSTHQQSIGLYYNKAGIVSVVLSSSLVPHSHGLCESLLL